MDLGRYNFFVGTARGSLICLTEKPSNIKYFKSETSSEVSTLAYGRNLDEIFIGYEDSTVCIFDTVKESFRKKPGKLEGEGRIVGLNSIGDVIIIPKRDGIVNLWTRKKNNHFDIGLDDKGTLDAAVLNVFSDNLLGTGGECNDFKLWNVETQQCVFRSKSLGHDMLNLPIPTSIRGIMFFPENDHLSACCTKEGHVLMYDNRAQRKPIVKFHEKQASYTTITYANRERQCLVGTTRGYVQLLDMKMGKTVKTFKTFTGSVTDIFCDPLEPFVFSVSLDRHLRIHNLETKELLHKIYMKQNLTKLLVKAVPKEETIKDETDEIVDEEYESLFRNMEAVGDAELKKKKKRKN